MPHLVGLPAAAAAAGLVLAALPLSAVPGSPAVADTGPGCRPDEVTVVVDFNELGGKTRISCTDHGGTTARLFEDAGFPLTYARAPGMQGFVCSVSGKPKAGPCTEGDSYWSLWLSDGSRDWSYATLGADQLEIEPGGYVAFAWHQGDADAEPPDVEIARDGTAAGDGEDVAAGAPQADTGREAADDDGPPAWVLAGGAVVVLGAAGVVPLVRRRRSR